MNKKKTSLGRRITAILMIQVAFLAVVLIVVSYFSFRKAFLDAYYEKAQNIVNIVAARTDWNLIENYAKTGVMDDGARETIEFYNDVKENFTGVYFLYLFVPSDTYLTYIIEAEKPNDEAKEKGLLSSYGDVYYYTEHEYTKLVPDIAAGKSSTELHIISDGIDTGLEVWAPVFDDEGNLQAMVEADYRIGDFNRKLNNFVLGIILLILVAVVIMSLVMYFYLNDTVSKPVAALAEGVTSYDHGTMKLDIKRFPKEDELKMLATSFEEMTARIDSYNREVQRITAEKERIGAELTLATKIQADMLPNIFPAFPERPEFDVYASMTPAKEVGGDFYDFFMIDEDHMGLTIADVSGKGIPAALFMMMAKILIGNYGMIYHSPAEVLDAVNKAVCKNNDEDMFITVWFGILTISTGHIVAANAGHEYPMIRKATGEFELLQDEHDFVVGGFDFTEFHQYEFDLEKGGTLFVYTDGLAEATNSAEEMFGTDRALEVLNRNPAAEPKELITRMKEAVDTFVGEAPQFDDLTMMAFVLH